MFNSKHQRFDNATHRCDNMLCHHWWMGQAQGANGGVRKQRQSQQWLAQSAGGVLTGGEQECNTKRKTRTQWCVRYALCKGGVTDCRLQAGHAEMHKL